MTTLLIVNYFFTVPDFVSINFFARHFCKEERRFLKRCPSNDFKNFVWSFCYLIWILSPNIFFQVARLSSHTLWADPRQLPCTKFSTFRYPSNCQAKPSVRDFPLLQTKLYFFKHPKSIIWFKKKKTSS